MDRIEEPADDEEVSFAPAPSPDEARARLAALRGKPLDAPSRLAVVSEEEPVNRPISSDSSEPQPVAQAAPASLTTVSIALPADKLARLLQMLSDDKPAEPQKPARAVKSADKPLYKPVKVRITTRVDADVLQAFKATGPGWQTLMNDVLRENMPGS